MTEKQVTPRPHTGAGKEPAMLTVQQVAERLSCSTRTVHRLSGSGRIPRSVKLGALVRWPRKTIDKWIAAGCPKPRKAVR